MVNSLIICLIDDDEVYKYTVTKTIEIKKLAKKTIVFSDGEEALKFIVENASNNTDLPDVILLDINMPIMDGFQFMEEYIKLKPRVGKNIVIYMVSSSVNDVDIERANKISEISDYIIKPIKSEQLMDIVERLVA